MKYVKLFMRDKKHNITLPMEKAQRVIQSPNQLVMIMDDNGQWTGQTVNKSEIISTDHDWDKEKEVLRENPRIETLANPITDEQMKELAAKFKI